MIKPKQNFKNRVLSNRARALYMMILKRLLNATVLDRRSQQFIKGPLSHFAGHSYRGFGFTINCWTWGCLRIESRSIDLIQIECVNSNVENWDMFVSSFNYVVLADVAGLEEELIADFKPIYEKEGFFGRKIIGMEWTGGPLARRLKADSELEIISIDRFA